MVESIPDLVLLNGEVVYYDAAMALMDDEIRERVYADLAPLFQSGVHRRIRDRSQGEVRRGLRGQLTGLIHCPQSTMLSVASAETDSPHE